MSPAGSPHVLHVSQPVEGGVGHVVLGLVRAQRARGWPVTLACPPGPGLAGPAADAGATVVAWPATRSPGPHVPGEALRLRRIARSVRPDLVHLHSAKAGLVGRLVLRGRVPTVYTPHGWSFHAAGGPLRRAVLGWERAAPRWCDCVLCVSEDERRTGARAGVRATWEVAENGVDLTRFRPSPDDRSRARARLGVAPDAPLAVCVGRLSEAKGQDLLLAAWPEVLREVPGARLVLVGDGPLTASLAALDVPGVALVGHADPDPWYAAADVVVVPSRWEGMALAPLEAMACGRSVVAFDVDGLPPVLRDHGAVVPAGRLPDLAAAVAHRLTSADVRTTEEAANRAAATERYDLDRSTAATLDVYAQVLAARRTRHG